jgi:hypothetical protein
VKRSLWPSSSAHFVRAFPRRMRMTRRILSMIATPLTIKGEALSWRLLYRVDWTMSIFFQYSAKKNLRDRAGLRAIEFAKPGQRNAKERFGRQHQIYKEDTFTSDRSRVQIVRILEDNRGQSTAPSGPETMEPSLDFHSSYRSPTTPSQVSRSSRRISCTLPTKDYRSSQTRAYFPCNKWSEA